MLDSPFRWETSEKVGCTRSPEDSFRLATSEIVRRSRAHLQGQGSVLSGHSLSWMATVRMIKVDKPVDPRLTPGISRRRNS